MRCPLKALAIIVVALSLVSAASVVDGAGGASDDVLLYDAGNGVTEWTGIGDGLLLESIAESLGSNGHELSTDGPMAVDGRTQITIGSVTTSWRLFSWGGSSWTDITGSVSPDTVYTGGPVAIAFLPEGTAPVETPDHRSSWTMIRGDALSSGSQTAELSGSEGSVTWEYNYGKGNYVTSTVLVAGSEAYVVAGGGYTGKMDPPTLYCYDRLTGEERWSFQYPQGSGYETATGTIFGGYIYLPATHGALYRIPLSGPGDDGSEVRMLDVDNSSDRDLIGTSYATGPASLVHDSGVLYYGACDGYVYCTDMDLNVIWRSPVDGRCYYSAPMVCDGTVFVGSLDGCVYAFDQVTGELLDREKVFSVFRDGREYGGVNTPVMVDGTVMFSFSDGRNMSAMEGGVAAYRFSDGSFTEVFVSTDPGIVSNYVLPVVTDGFSGVYFLNNDGLCRVSTDGAFELLRAFDDGFKAPLMLVNGDTLYASGYGFGTRLYTMTLDGDVVGMMEKPDLVDEHTMTALVIIDGMFYNGTDGGVFAYSGAMPSVSGGGVGAWAVAAVVLVIVLLLFAAYCIHGGRTRGMPPMVFMRSMFSSGSGGTNVSRIRRNKRKLAVVLVVGLAIGFVLFIASLAYGPGGNYSLGETMSILGSAIGKTFAGQGLTDDEVIVFDSRCSRAVAAFVVGFGLSISGSIYQAIIRNPMVDPYIMGVSAGAGVAAIACIAFNFTFFGLLDNITYVTPIVAMVGGVVAFGATMILAEKSGGSSINYVLAGVIIGLVFSAIQTLMLSMAGDKLNSAMSWLFGSFANVNWEQAIVMAIPAITLSLIPLVWAKEFNLVLLGEDQARQMGLDVRRFNRWMLILASVLASVCVAFVGIIGFVGLVVPHLCRMILGGDHRLVMPASMVVGGALMLAADLFAKMVMIPMELPVGAITTVIGAPVFAYLLIKKGRMYDG